MTLEKSQKCSMVDRVVAKNYYVNVVDIGAKHGEITKGCSKVELNESQYSRNRTRKKEKEQATY